MSGSGTVIPRIAAIAAIIDSSRDWESTLVTIPDVEITVLASNSTGTNYMISDATGQLSSFVRNTAGIAMPALATGITGYVSVFQSGVPGAAPEIQITLRTQADISGGTGGAFAVVYDFKSVTSSSGATDPGSPPETEGIHFSPFTAVGLSANSSAGGRFSFSGWPVGAKNGSDVFDGAPDMGRYYEITIT